MLNYLNITLAAINFITFIAVIWIAIRVRSRRPTTDKGLIEQPAHNQVDLAMNELLEKSRPAGGKIHIHDVEEVVRRRLG